MQKSAELLYLFFLKQCNSAAETGIFAAEYDGGGHLLHGQVSNDAAQLTAARGAAGQLGPTVGADQVAGVTLQNRRQHIVITHWALEQAGQVAARVGRGGLLGARPQPATASHGRVPAARGAGHTESLRGGGSQSRGKNATLFCCYYLKKCIAYQLSYSVANSYWYRYRYR